MNKTQIFKKWSDFNKRADKSVNGVSEKFAKKHSNWREMNATNTGCWNCVDCENCNDSFYCVLCRDCDNCFHGYSLLRCKTVFYKEFCVDCVDYINH